MENKQLETLTHIEKGLYETTKVVLPFDKRYRIKSFVLERPSGNIIIYHSPGLNEADSDIQLLGGATRVLMNHEHESLGGHPRIDVPFWIHRDDVAAIRHTVAIDGQFEQRETIANDLEVIPTPGHTPGTTMFLWNNGEHRFLFTGDFLCVEGGEWRTVILRSSDRDASIKSLEMIRDLAFDAIVPWVAIEGEDAIYYVENEEDKQNRVQNIIDRVRRGENT
ncbi:MBL fold metallo-hydrolase [Staphylococcus borealis]|uniref:MBL fold metallo-hydrolase n=1 Tax=Staphylococcus borealis TaxID=2742203 RepID=UPI0039EB3A47